MLYTENIGLRDCSGFLQIESHIMWRQIQLSVIGHLSGQVSRLSDNNEVWSNRLSDQRIRREPKGLSCICLVDCESDHDVRSIMCMV